MNKKEKREISYRCERLGRSVQITLEYIMNPINALVGFDCDGCYTCGVGKEGRPGSWIFDWSKCIHPKRSIST